MPTTALRSALGPLFVALLLCAAVGAQGEQTPAVDQATKAALHQLAEDLADRRAELQRTADAARAQALTAEIRQLRWEFAELATHLDVQEFEEPADRRIELEREVLELVAPLIQAVKEATAEPRELAALKERRARALARREVALTARRRIEATKLALDPESLEAKEVDRELRERWQPLLDDLGRELLVIDANLRRREQSQRPLLTTLTESLQSFLQSSGLNVLLCVATFLTAFFGLRWISDRALRRKRQRGFSVRLAEVLARVLAVLVAIAGTMAVLYARNDWLLLPIGIIFLVGAGWVVAKAAPLFFEQIRLILNVGPVREGERLLVDGLPYRVDALQFYSRLVNPALSGGLLRVPVKDLIGMRSRPLGHDEPWFPCSEGDVVALSDGVVGRVELQTPEVVMLVERSDAPRSYPTVTFLDMHPRNLSRGFEIALTFGVDYAHLTDAAARVPRTLEGAVRRGLADDERARSLKAVRVEISAAGESAIDYAVLVTFGGEAALHYHDLHRQVNTLLVEACAERGIGIPFPQLRLHGLPLAMTDDPDDPDDTAAPDDPDDPDEAAEGGGAATGPQ